MFSHNRILMLAAILAAVLVNCYAGNNSNVETGSAVGLPAVVGAQRWSSCTTLRPVLRRSSLCGARDSKLTLNSGKDVPL